MRSLRMVEITQQENYGFNDMAIKAILDGWSSVLKACWIYHNKDPEVFPHWHCFIKFKSPVPLDSIIKHANSVLAKKGCEYVFFGDERVPMLPAQQFQMIKSRWSSCVAYLTHSNDLTKHQYRLDEVYTYNMTLEEVEDETKQGSNTTKILNSVLEGIESGELREYNLVDYVGLKDYIILKRKIDYAFQWKMNRLMNNNKVRQMKVFYIWGKTGVGKSTLARDIVEKQHWSSCVSSSSNDPMQDYRGEDCLILDDFRPKDWVFSDLLKLLDNHYISSVKSRYCNKQMCYCKAIIITTTLKLSDVLDGFRNAKGEDTEQLKRRITYMCGFSDDGTKVLLSEYDYSIKDFRYKASRKNPVFEKHFAKLQDDAMLESMGFSDFEDVDRQLLLPFGKEV